MSGRKKVLEKYRKLQEKHDLNDLEVLEEELGVFLEKNCNPVEVLTGKIRDRIFVAQAIVDKLHHPQNIAQRYEADFFTGKEKEELFSIYKKIRIINSWIYLKKRSSEKEKDRVDYFKKILSFWREEVKPFMISISNKMINKWKEETGKDDFDKYYMG